MLKNETLGIMLKRLRLDNKDEKMKDMATKLGVSMAFLSSVENGKRKMNDEMYRKLIENYKLDKEQIEELDYLRDTATNKLKIDIEELDEDKKQTLVKFVSQVDSLDRKELEKINMILKKDKEKGEKK